MRRAKGSWLRAAGKLALVLSLLLPAAPALGQPSASNPRAELDRLAARIAALNEDHNSARIRLAGVERQVRQNQRDKHEADLQVQRLRGAASARAAAMYRIGFPGVLLIFFGSNDQGDFARRMGAASRVGSWENGLLNSLQIANQHADRKAEDLSESLAEAKRIRDGLTAKRAALQVRQAEQARVLERSLAAARAARAAAARAARGPGEGRPARALAALSPRVQNARIPLPANLAASGGARTAMQTAYDQTGKPYKWGAAGPGSFDCSGLTMFAWRSAGVSLPHSSRAQFAATKRVARSELQPGDLVFFGSPIHHVGLYVGDGKMINSPETGERVGVRSMERRDYAGAGRPGV